MNDGHSKSLRSLPVSVQVIFSLLSSLLLQLTGSWAKVPSDIWAKELSELDFAEDIASQSNSTHDLQELVTNIGEFQAGLGLSINGKKTKNMLIGEHLMSSLVEAK